MTKFVYKFESIKRIKETLEKKVRKEISVLENEIECMNMKLNNVLLEIEKTKNSLSGKKSIKASELQFLSDVEYLLELDVEKIRVEISRLENLKQVKLNELVEKKQRT